MSFDIPSWENIILLFRKMCLWVRAGLGHVAFWEPYFFQRYMQKKILEKKKLQFPARHCSRTFVTPEVQLLGVDSHSVIAASATTGSGRGSGDDNSTAAADGGKESWEGGDWRLEVWLKIAHHGSKLWALQPWVCFSACLKGVSCSHLTSKRFRSQEVGSDP